MEKLIPCLFLIFVTISCSNPVQKDYSNITPAPKKIYQANEKEKISEISVSPRQGKLAMVLETRALKIESEGMSQTYDLPYTIIEQIYVSTNAEALAYVSQGNLFLQNLLSGKMYEVDLGEKQLLNIKWQNDCLALIVLLKSMQQYFLAQYYFNNDQLEERILLVSERSGWQCADFNSMLSTLCYIANSAQSHETYIYWQRIDQQRVDSLRTDQNSTNLSIDESGQNLAWTNGKNLYILNFKTRQLKQTNLEKEIKFPPVWHGHKLLLNSEDGVFVLDSNQLDRFSSLYSKSAQNDENVQGVWSPEGGEPAFARQVTRSKLLVYNSNMENIDLQLEFENAKITNLSWDESGQKLLYLQDKQVQIFDLELHQSQSLNLPFHYLPLVRWGPEKGWLSFIGKAQKIQKQYFFEVKTGRLKEFDIQLYSTIKDFSWTDKTKKVIYSIPQISRLFTYKYTGAELKYEKAYTLVADAVRWAPNNTDISQKIGEYAVFKAQPTLGVYFLKSNNLNWILHLESKKIVDFDWAPDGKSIYYVLKEENKAPVVMLEQILYLDEI